LKFQNVYMNPLLKPKNASNKPYFETAYLGENVKSLIKQKVMGAGKTMYLLSARFHYRNGYLASYPDLT
jgi:hypothetical protein